MRLELEKKEQDDPRHNNYNNHNHNNHNHQQTHHNQQNNRLGLTNMTTSLDASSSSSDMCLNNSFTSLHYDNQDSSGIVSRDDSLDLYGMRDDCYTADDNLDSMQNCQNKFNGEYNQVYQHFTSSQTQNLAFQQNPCDYQILTDYQIYQNTPSTSR